MEVEVEVVEEETKSEKKNTFLISFWAFKPVMIINEINWKGVSELKWKTILYTS